ncbi:MAG: dynamin family protein [Clostridia bacterium]|nr:dynamin family protein [Clostridia bacterium]
MVSNNDLQYLSYKKKQMYLADLFKQASEISTELNLNKMCVNLKNLGRKIYADSFKIQIVGTFKNGKSTFINSFLGEDVLPAYALPCTAVINEVKYGKEKKAVLHFKNPLPKKLPVELSARAKAHMRRFLPGPVPPMAIAYDEIEDYVVIPIGKDPREMLLESPYEKVELFWPLELLKNGVEIIDSPGLNEHATRTKVTIDYLSKADAIIFVLSATSLCSLEEMKFIENTLHAQNFNDIFFVVNRFDLIGENEKRNVVEYANSKLSRYTSFGTNGIYFVSAKNALEAKKDNDAEKLCASAMPGFEERLSLFLTNEKGVAKLSQPAFELRRILLNEIMGKAVLSQRKLINTSIDELKGKYRAVTPRLEELKSKKEQSLKKMQLLIEQSRYDFEYVSRSIINEFSSRVNSWVDEYTPQTKIGVVPKKERIKKLTAEITDYVSEKITAEQNVWKKRILLPLLEEKAAEIFSEAESDFEHLFSELDSVHSGLSGDLAVAMQRNSVWKRVAGVAGGLVNVDLSCAVTGGTSALSSDTAKKVGVTVGAQSVLVAFGILNPFAICAFLFGTVAFGMARNETNVIKKVKDKVCDEFVTSINASIDENAKAMAKSVTDKFMEIANSLVSALDAEISQTENQIRTLISEMEKGRISISSKQKDIDNCNVKAKTVVAKTEALIRSFRK